MKWDAYRKTDATVEPVTVSEAKTHLRVDWSTDDTYIGTLIAAARQRCEAYSNRAYISQTWVMKLSKFASVIQLPMPRLISITSLKYTTKTGTQTTLTENTDFKVDRAVEPGIIFFPTWLKVPPADYGGEYPVEIEYLCGYGASAASVPQHVKQAILLQVGNLYENRENIIVGQGIAQYRLNQGAEFLLDVDRMTPI